METNISVFSECANCGACYNICPVDAISVDKESLFYTVKVSEDKCISCGKCVSVCPVNREQHRQKLMSAFGGWHKNHVVREKSSSGGAFSAVADYILSQNGAVFGAVFSQDRHEVIFESTDETDLDEIRRSKYVESSVAYCFRALKDKLKTGRKILFCGTPCQVAGLTRFLGRDYENLLTCDFACGGLPSHEIYNDYLYDLEEKYHSIVLNVNFRSKMYGWSTHSQKITFQNGKKYCCPAILDSYFYGFIYDKTTIRENCRKCKFKNNHYADLILADLWKWKTVSKLPNSEKGISLIITNSEKGQRTVEKIQAMMRLEALDLGVASYNCMDDSPLDEMETERRKGFLVNLRKSGLYTAAVHDGMKTGVDAAVVNMKIKARCLKRRLIKKKNEE